MTQTIPQLLLLGPFWESCPQALTRQSSSPRSESQPSRMWGTSSWSSLQDSMQPCWRLPAWSMRTTSKRCGSYERRRGSQGGPPMTCSPPQWMFSRGLRSRWHTPGWREQWAVHQGRGPCLNTAPPMVQLSLKPRRTPQLPQAEEPL